MLRDDVEVTLRDTHGDAGLLYPAYDDYSFGNVPATVTSVFGSDGERTLPDDVFEGVDTDVDHVVLVLLDGFGLERWKDDHDEHELFRGFTNHGTVTPLTTIYPSETAAAITTVHTGSLPAEHGVIGWDLYLPEADDVVETFSWEPAGDSGVTDDQDALFEGTTIYERLEETGVASHVYQPADTLGGSYADLTLAGAERHPYENAAEMALSLRRTLESADGQGQSYHYAYLPHVDAMAHRHGTTSEDYRAQLSMIAGCLRRELMGELSPDAAAETLLLVTADHGLIDTDPAEYVNLVENEAVWENLERHADGEPIPPVGGPRNAHLHLREGTVHAVADTLRAEYGARTFTRSEAIDLGLFGDRTTSDRFERRCGDLIVTHPTRSMYHGEDKPYIGRHGGLHPVEMLIPFAAANLGDL